MPNVIHDLRNILTTLNAGVRMLGRSVGQERQEMLLAGMDQALSTATKLTNSLFDVAGHDEHCAHGFDLAARLINILSLYEPVVPAKVKLTADIRPGLEPIMAGPADLDRAVLNLLMNACEAMPSGGHLILRARNHGAERVRVIVADTGCGMTPDLIRRAGVAGLTRKVGPGHGLGLAQVRRFARANGGRFMLRSAPNRGTVAILEMPAGCLPRRTHVDAPGEGEAS
ncbi:sensor histidine kinase [Sphingopyxis chilensis]